MPVRPALSAVLERARQLLLLLPAPLNRGFLHVSLGFFLTAPLYFPPSSLAAEFSGAASIQAAPAPTSPGYPTPRVKGKRSGAEKPL